LAPDKVFVTGASGFVGAHILEALRAAGYPVRVLRHCHPERSKRSEPFDFAQDRLRRRTDDTFCEFVEGDLENPGELVHAMDGCRYLVHCAAQYSFAPRDASAIARINIAGTEGLFAVAHLAGVERAVLTSSSAAVGPAHDGRLADERDHPPAHYHRPRVASYHESKVLQERAAFASRVPTVAVLPTTPVGPADWKPTPTGAMIVDFARGKMVARPPKSGGMNLVDVVDVAQAHVAALERGRVGERYIVGGENLTFDALWELLAEVTGRTAASVRAPLPLMFAAAYVDEARSRITGATPFVPLEGVRMSRDRMFVDSTKAQLELGVRPHPVRDALAGAVAWYREHGYFS
jgi:dihydroflavonol-4-reductase